MDDVEEQLEAWRSSAVGSIPIAGLLQRSSAYAWLAPFRCWLVREAAFWRLTDLLTQSLALHRQGHGLGARILLRSGFETLAVLVYLNVLIERVLRRNMDFFDFDEATRKLLLGSRNGSTAHESTNILTMLDKCDRRYPGVRRVYDDLSESAHPNHDGMLFGYSDFDRGEYETRFSNRWMSRFGKSAEPGIALCMAAFEIEYNQVWRSLMEAFETWIEENDEDLKTVRRARDAG